LVLWDAARHSVNAVRDGVADTCFLAVDPVRANELAFTRPCVQIEGAYLVPEGSPMQVVEDVDRAEVQIGVKLGSAFDLYLTRTIRMAELVRGTDGVDVFAEQGLHVAAGVRQPVERCAAEHSGLRVLRGSFMEIAQVVAVARRHNEQVVAWVRDVVDELIASGWVARSLERHGHDRALRHRRSRRRAVAARRPLGGPG